MTGYRSKKASSEIRWLGPYASTDRHCDTVTMDHVIALREQVSELERQLDNVLSWVKPMQRSNESMKAALHWIAGCEGGNIYDLWKEMRDTARDTLEEVG